MNESDIFSTNVLKQMREINSIDLRNATPEERYNITNDMQKLYTKYKNKKENGTINGTFDVSIIQAMKGFEDKNPGLEVIKNYND